jgi:hypothetical protein
MPQDDLDKTPGLHRVPEAELVRLLRALARDEVASPTTRAGLLLARFTADEANLDPVIGQPKNAAIAMLSAVVRERRQRAQTRAALAWSGPAANPTSARDPFELLSDLLATAQRSVLWCGARLDRDQRLLRALHVAVQTRQLSARILLDDVGQPAAQLPGLARELFRGDEPRLSVRLADRSRLTGPLPHFVLGDGQRALLLLGTPPEADGDSRALNVGVLAHDPTLCADLSAQFEALVEDGCTVAI